MSNAKLEVNDKDVPMNEFIETILINLCKAFIDSLKDIPEDLKSMKVEIDF